MATEDLTAWEALGEEQLLSQARQGSKNAIQEIIQRHEPFLRFFLRGRLNRQCRRVVDVEDVLQDIRLDFSIREVPAEAMAAPGTFLKYLLRAALNKSREVYRRWVKRQKRNLAHESGALTYEPVDKHDPDWLNGELLEEAIDLYFRLPDQVREIYLLRLHHNTPQQIANILGISLAQVYRGLKTAQGRLQSTLFGGGVELSGCSPPSIIPRRT